MNLFQVRKGCTANWYLGEDTRPISVTGIRVDTKTFLIITVGEGEATGYHCLVGVKGTSMYYDPSNVVQRHA